MVDQRVEPDAGRLRNVRLVKRPGVVSAEIASPLDEQHPDVASVMRECVRQQTALEAAADEHVFESIGPTHAALPNPTVGAA